MEPKLGESIASASRAGISKRTSPLADPSCRTRKFGRVEADDLLIFVRTEVLKEIVDYSNSSLVKMVGGIMVGSAFESDGRLAVEIEGYIPGQRGVSTQSTFKFTQSVWKDAAEARDRMWPGKLIVGWHVTMPSFGVFMSQQNEECHRSYFGSEFQVHLCVDPVSGNLGFFQWRKGTLVSDGFYSLDRK